MEAIGGIASIGTILDLSNKVIDYILQVRGAKESRSQTVARIRGIMLVLLNLQDCARDCEGAEIWAEILRKLAPSFKRLQEALGSVADVLMKCQHVLVWPRISKQIEQLERIVEQEKSLLELAFQSDVGKIVAAIAARSKSCGEQLTKLKELVLDFQASAQDQFQHVTTKIGKIEESHSNLYRGVKRVHEHQLDRKAETDREKVLNWLSASDLAPSFRTASAERQPDSGKWLLDSVEYQNWLHSPGQTLFCPGIPGAGKTVMSSIVVSDLYDRHHVNSDVGIACFVFDFAYREKHTTEDILKDIMKQLGQRRDLLPTPILDFYNTYNERQSSPIPVASIKDTLRLAINSFSSVYLVFDALDECSEKSGCQRSILRVLLDIQADGKLNIFATSRFIPSIIAHFEGGPSVEIRASKIDLERYIQGRHDNLPSYDSLSLVPVAIVQQKIIDSVDGVFLLARYLFDSMTEAYSVGEVRTMLDGLSRNSVNWTSVYDTKFQRVKDQDAKQAKLAMRALKWTAFAMRPLSSEELRDALGFEEMGTVTMDSANRPNIDHILHACTGLLTVDEDDTVRLIHYTLQEYLDVKEEKWFSGAMVSIAESCISYLSSDVFRIPFNIVESYFYRYSFVVDPSRISNDPVWHISKLYGYAAENWGHHARQAPASLDRVMAFLSNPFHVELVGQILEAFSKLSTRFPSSLPVKSTNALHLAAGFGLESAAGLLLEHTSNPDVTNSENCTPLMLAIIHGHEDVVKLLLSRGASPLSNFHHGESSPLGLAIDADSASMIKILLDAGANVFENPHEYWWALDSAIGMPHPYPTVQVLLEHGADPNAMIYGSTILHKASSAGLVDVVDLLIQHGADQHLGSRAGTAAIHEAARNGHADVVDLLIQHGADPNYDSYFGTAMIIAARRGHASVVNILLQRGADLCIEGSDGTPMHEAVRNGYADIVDLLINCGAEVDIFGTCERTPLSLANSHQHWDICKRLVQAGADPYGEDSFGDTPIAEAYYYANKYMVQWFLSLESDKAVKLRAINSALKAPESHYERYPGFLTDIEECKQLLLDAKAALERPKTP